MLSLYNDDLHCMCECFKSKTWLMIESSVHYSKNTGKKLIGCWGQLDTPPAHMTSFIDLFEQEIFARLPKQRRLTQQDRKEVQSLSQMKVNKKLLQQHISNKTGKRVTLKDISNIQGKMNAGCSLDSLVSRLRESEGKSCMLIVSNFCHYLCM